MSPSRFKSPKSCQGLNAQQPPRKSDLAFLTGTGVGPQGAAIGLQMSVAP